MFVVGVAGGVPHYTDYKRHVRLGDVVVSTAAPAAPAAAEKPFVYAYSSGDDRRTYHPVNACLQDIARGLSALVEASTDAARPWETYLNDGLAHLQARTENDFRRPAANSDKLYMNIGNRDVIEVAHPQPQQQPTAQGEAGAVANRIHLGPIGSSKDVGRSDQARTEFVQRFGLVATDLEMSSVLDSIIGNCRDSFIVVKGESYIFPIFVPPIQYYPIFQ